MKSKFNTPILCALALSTSLYSQSSKALSSSERQERDELQSYMSESGISARAEVIVTRNKKLKQLMKTDPRKAMILARFEAFKEKIKQLDEQKSIDSIEKASQDYTQEATSLLNSRLEEDKFSLQEDFLLFEVKNKKNEYKNFDKNLLIEHKQLTQDYKVSSKINMPLIKRLWSKDIQRSLQDHSLEEAQDKFAYLQNSCQKKLLPFLKTLAAKSKKTSFEKEVRDRYKANLAYCSKDTDELILAMHLVGEIEKIGKLVGLIDAYYSKESLNLRKKQIQDGATRKERLKEELKSLEDLLEKAKQEARVTTLETVKQDVCVTLKNDKAELLAQLAKSNEGGFEEKIKNSLNEQTKNLFEICSADEKLIKKIFHASAEDIRKSIVELESLMAKLKTKAGEEKNRTHKALLIFKKIYSDLL